MKSIHFYNGMYFARDTNTSECRKCNSIIGRNAKLFQLGSEFMKRNPKTTSSDLSDLLHEFNQIFNTKGGY